MTLRTAAGTTLNLAAVARGATTWKARGGPARQRASSPLGDRARTAAVRTSAAPRPTSPSHSIRITAAGPIGHPRRQPDQHRLSPTRATNSPG